jgi:hypothetical protein
MSTENQTTALETLVGEGKKFKDLEALAKGKLEADEFIKTLEGTIKSLADELKQAQLSADRKATLENLMSSLTTTTKTSETKEPSQPQNPSNQSGSGLSHDDVVKIMEAREAAKRQAQNLNLALAPVKKLYGDKTDEVLAQKAQELGMTVEALETLAKQSPQAFLNVVGVNARDNSTRSMATHSSVNSLGSTDPGAPQERNKAYYDKLRKEMGAWKFATDSKLQVQLHKDMQRLGDAWDS